MDAHSSAKQAMVITQRGTPRSRRVGKLGRVLEGRYELKYLIGRGGMCEVHAAYDRILERTVAIKMLKCELADSAHLERLRREAAAMARVESGMATGTPEFMAPEQLEAAPVDNRTDLYLIAAAAG